MGRRRLLSAIGAAFCAGALMATAALRVPAPAHRGLAAAARRAIESRGDAPGTPGSVAGTPARPDRTRDATSPRQRDEDGVAATPRETRGTSGTNLDVVNEELRARDLLMPVRGVDAKDLTDTFTSARGTGQHEALDILAPRHTPVRAVEDGRIVKLFTSERGGLTIYQFDPSERYCYYYAHLDAYADGIAEGQHVERGTVIGYVGTTGNAPKDTPHLHFAVFVLGPERHWWQGTAIDPFPLFRG